MSKNQTDVSHIDKGEINEPIAWKIEELDYVTSSKLSMDGWVAKGMTITPLYTHPQKKLSDDEIIDAWKMFPNWGHKQHILMFGKELLKKASKK
jgi:hypothetical protein